MVPLTSTVLRVLMVPQESTALQEYSVRHLRLRLRLLSVFLLLLQILQTSQTSPFTSQARRCVSV